MIVFFVTPVFQETRIRASEKDPLSKAQNICISNQYGGEEVTHTVTTDSREETHRWMEAFWQHFYDMSRSLCVICTQPIWSFNMYFTKQDSM